MSHFTCLVIGNNPDEQLAPYNEDIQVAEYKKGEISKEDIDRFIKYYTKKHPEDIGKSIKELYIKYGKDWNSGLWKEDENGVLSEYSTYNPNSKWDWYTLGGRWRGFFKLKEKVSDNIQRGESGVFTADVCIKEDIDIEGMRNESGKKATERYDKVMNIIGHLPINKTWEEIREENKDDIEVARDLYWKQERCQMWKDTDLGWGSSPDDFIMSREKYIENARNSAITPFSILKDGKWYEKGEMGWWGISTNDIDERDWSRFVNNLIDELPSDTILSLYDLHI